MAAGARGEVLWEPPDDVLDTTELGGYLDWLRARRALTFASYHELWRWSVDDLAGFWSSIAEWSGTIWHRAPTTTLASPAMPGTRWFEGGLLNYTEHALRAAGERSDETAVVAHSQS